MKVPVRNIVIVLSLLLPSFTLYAQTSEIDSQIDSIGKSLLTQKEDSTRVFTLITLSTFYQLNYPDSGLVYAQKALALAEKLQFNKGIFWSIVNINKSLYILGNYALELDYAFRAYPIGKKLNDPYTIGWANGMIGDCYFNLGEYATSLKYYREVIKTAEQNSLEDLFSIYSILAPVFIKLHWYDSALHYARKGYALFKQNPSLDQDGINSKYAKSLLFRFLGEAFEVNSHYDSALFYYRLSIPFSTDIHMELNKIEVYNGIANVYKEKRLLDSATLYAKKVLAEQMIRTYPVGFLKAANTLADVYQLQSKPDSALKYLRLALSIKDSLFNREKTVAVQNIFFKEQEKQKELQAATDRLENRYWVSLLIALLIALLITAGILIRNRRIKQLQKIRTRIADDLHDDIGSTLSSISIMSELAKTKPPESAQLLASISESTLVMQENMSDIVWTLKSRNDRFENVLKRMNQFASEMLEAKNIELEFTSDISLSASRIPMEQRKNLYLFFKEVINNAAKYSNAQKVSVMISQKDRYAEMNISDNGKGFDTNKTSSGNGMNTLKKRAAELSGDFKIISALNEGTSVQLKFKIT